MSVPGTTVLIDFAGEAERLGLHLLDSRRGPLEAVGDPFRGILAVRRQEPRRILLNLARLGARESTFLRALEGVRRDSEVVLLVPRPLRADAEAAARSGGYRVLVKPFLHHRLADLLGADRPAQERAPSRVPTVGAEPPEATPDEPDPAGENLEEEIRFLDSLAIRLGNLDELLRLTLERAIAAAGAARGSVQFLDEAGRELRVSKAIGQGAPILEEMVRPVTGGVAGSVIRLRRPRRGDEGVPESETLPARAQSNLAGPYLSLPIVFSGAIFGVLHVVRPSGANAFTEEDERRLEAMVSRVAGFLRNAVELQEKDRLARVDALTGLYNRRYFDERLAREIRRAQRYGHPLTLLLLDIDDFKRFNDRHGLQAGDAALRAVADVLRRTFREVDVVSRWGGEEFAVLLPETGRPVPEGDEPPEHPFATRLLAAVARARFPGREDDPEARLTLSGGAATFPDDTQDPGELISLANRAMRRAKRDGKNRIYFV